MNLCIKKGRGFDSRGHYYIKSIICFPIVNKILNIDFIIICV
jgi:hypothetical protein